jgi:hypothetical protein
MTLSGSHNEVRTPGQAIEDRIRAAYSRLYDDQIDVDAAFAEFQARLGAAQHGEPVQRIQSVQAAQQIRQVQQVQQAQQVRQARRGHRRNPRRLPRLATSSAVAAVIAAAATGLVLTGPPGTGTGSPRLTASHPASPQNLTRPPVAASHSEDGEGTAPPGRTGTATGRGRPPARAAALPHSLERGQRPVDRTFPLKPGATRFTAVIPPAGGDGTAPCTWVLTASNGRAKKVRASPWAPQHVVISLKGAQSLRITSASPDQAPASCAIRQMSEHGMPPAAGSPGPATSGTTPSGPTTSGTTPSGTTPSGATSSATTTASATATTPAGSSPAGITPGPAGPLAPAPQS